MKIKFTNGVIKNDMWIIMSQFDDMARGLCGSHTNSDMTILSALF